MAIAYRVYANDGQGGDVDYATPVATSAACSYVAGPLAAPSDNTFAVRAFDTVSGIEEANTDARVRVVIDSSGNDVSASPNPVIGLLASATAGATCWVAWCYDPTGQGGPPSWFEVATTPGPSSPAIVAYLPGIAGYGCSLSGLPANTPCTVAVRAVGASGSLPGPLASIAFTYPVSPLGPVNALAATASP